VSLSSPFAWTTVNIVKPFEKSRNPGGRFKKSPMPSNETAGMPFNADATNVGWNSGALWVASVFCPD
jgi:hypothetical protein